MPDESVITATGVFSGFELHSQSASFDTLTTHFAGILHANLSTDTIEILPSSHLEALDVRDASGAVYNAMPGPFGSATPAAADFAATVTIDDDPNDNVPGATLLGAIREFSLGLESFVLSIDPAGNIATSELTFLVNGGYFDYRVIEYPIQSRTPLVLNAPGINVATESTRLLNTVRGIELRIPIDIHEESSLGGAPYTLDFRGEIVAVADRQLPGDLVARSFAVVSGTVSPGEPLEVAFTVLNAGWETARNVVVDLRLFGGNTIRSSDPLLATFEISSLAPRESYRGAFQVVLPAAPPANLGTPDLYKLGLWVDSDNQVAELDEGNNQAALPVIDGLFGSGADVLDVNGESLILSLRAGETQLYHVQVSEPGKLRLDLSTSGSATDAELRLFDYAGNLLTSARLTVNGATVIEAHATPGEYLVSIRAGAEGLFSIGATLIPASAPQSELKTGNKPTAPKLADLNGDGWVDLVMGNFNSHGVSVLLGRGDGTFVAEKRFAVVEYPGSPEIVDLNGDGRLDLVTANSGSNNVSVLLGLGDGTFAAENRFVVGGHPTWFQLVDLNGDGRLDLVTANGHSADVSVLLGLGDGTFAAENRFGVGGYATSLQLADLNGDGRLDLVTANDDSADVSVLLGLGDGTFAAQHRFGVGDGPRSLQFFDLNGDGRLDLVTANGYSGDISVLLGMGDGTFAAQHRYGVGDYPTSLQLVDLNGDGRLDLVTANSHSADVSVLLGLGDGTFAAQHRFGVGGYATSLQLVDLNGDGRLDLVTANGNSADVSVLLGLGDGTFAAENRFGVGGYATSLQLVDLNGDGRLDLVTANFDSIAVLLGLGDGSFLDATDYDLGRSVELADLNGDGRLDIVTVNNSSIAVLLGLGYGGFATPRHYGIGSYPSDLELADLNGDGRLDIVALAGGYDSYVSILFGLGDGSFHPARNYQVWYYARALALADINSDGLIDIVTVGGGFHQGSVTVLLGVEAGSFQLARNYAAGSDPSAIKLGDLNGDGRLDIVAWTSYYNSSIAVLIGLGDGSFQTARHYGIGSNPSDLELADLNWDGRLDVVAVEYYLGSVSVLMGLGDGTFLAARHFRIGSYPSDLELADLNGDGRLDIVTGIIGSIAVLIGLGDGSFETARQYGIGSYPSDLELADLNGDGRLDVVAVESRSVSVMLGVGDAIFSARREYIVEGYSSALKLADLNGDDRLDVVTASSVLLGLGDGTFQSPRVWNVGVSGERVLLGSGGDLDSVPDTVTLTADGALLFRRGSTAGFGEPVVLNVGEPARDAVLIQSVGTVVVAALDRVGSRIMFHAIDLAGRITSAGGPILAAKGSKLAAADLDGDGDPDLVVLSQSEGTAQILLAQWDGYFQAQTEIKVGEYPAHVSFADVDGTGTTDVIVTSRYSGDVTILRNLGGAQFTVARLNASVFARRIDASSDGTGSARINSWDETLQTVIGDFTGDGRLDLVSINAANHSFVLFVGDRAGNFERAAGFTQVTDAPIHIAAGDFNSDGALDLAVLTTGEDKHLRVYLGDGRGHFTRGFVERMSAATTSLVAADLTGDGLVDLLVSNPVGDLLVLRNKGDGTFEKVTGKTVALAVADLNGDGKDDVVLSNEQRDRVSIQFGQREGEFDEVAAKGTESGLLSPESVRLVDLDGDGLLDMVVVNSAANRILVFHGQAGGTFGNVYRFDVGTAPAGVTFNDLNGDAVLDMVVTNRGSNDVMILFGRLGAESEAGGAAGGAETTGAGAGAESGGWTVGTKLRVANVGSGPVSTDVLDTNADGIDDLLVTNSDGTLTMVPGGTPEGAPNDGFFTNDPDRFQRLLLNPGTAQSPGQIGDVNGDGLADYVTSNPFGNSITFVSNIGTAFTSDFDPSRIRSFTSNLLNRPSAFISTDFNRDGALDLVVANRADGRFTLLAGGSGGLEVEDSFFVEGLRNPTALALAGLEGSTLRLYAVGEADENVFTFEYIFGGPKGPGTNQPGGPEGPNQSLTAVNNPSLLFLVVRGVTNLFQNILAIFSNLGTVADGVRPEDASESGALSRRSLTNNIDMGEAIRLFQSELAKWAKWLEETLGETLDAINRALGTRITTDDVGRLGGEILRILAPPGWMQLGDLLGTLWLAVERAGQEGAEEGAEGSSQELKDQNKSAAIDAVFGGEEGGTDDAATEWGGAVHWRPLVAGATQTASCLGQPEIGDWTKDEEIDEVAGTWEERDDGNLLWLAPPRQRTCLGQPAVESDSGTDFELGWEEEEFGLALGLAGVASLVGRKSKCSGPRWRARDRHAAR